MVKGWGVLGFGLGWVCVRVWLGGWMGGCVVKGWGVSGFKLGWVCVRVWLGGWMGDFFITAF